MPAFEPLILLRLLLRAQLSRHARRRRRRRRPRRQRRSHARVGYGHVEEEVAPHPKMVGHNHVRPPVACAARSPTRRSKPVTSPRRARQRLEAQPAHHVHQHELHRVVTQRPEAVPVTGTTRAGVEAVTVMEPAAHPRPTRILPAAHGRELRELATHTHEQHQLKVARPRRTHHRDGEGAQPRARP